MPVTTPGTSMPRCASNVPVRGSALHCCTMPVSDPEKAQSVPLIAEIAEIQPVCSS